jgi:tetratricopeptide (TPR) repeat protein
LEALGKPKEARAAFTAALALDSTLDEARFSLKAHATKLDEVATKKTLKKDAERWYRLGSAQVAAGRMVDGTQALQRYLELSPKNPSALQALGEALEAMGRYRPAADAFARPEDPSRHVLHSKALIRLLRDEAAAAAAAEKVAEAPLLSLSRVRHR